MQICSNVDGTKREFQGTRKDTCFYLLAMIPATCDGTHGEPYIYLFFYGSHTTNTFGMYSASMDTSHLTSSNVPLPRKSARG